MVGSDIDNISKQKSMPIRKETHVAFLRKVLKKNKCEYIKPLQCTIMGGDTAIDDMSE
jgi:hypothetical protein